MSRTPGVLILAVALGLFVAGTAVGQVSTRLPGSQSGALAQPWDPALEFLRPYGIHNFSAHYIAALRTLLEADQLYRLGHYAGAQAVLDALWAAYPTGHQSWGSLPTKPFGINIGSPPCYYALRMLTDMTEWRVNNPFQPPPPRTARLTVLVVGQTNGIEPRNLQELLQGGGIQVTHSLDARVAQDDYQVVHESLRLFREYVLSATQGLLGVETQILAMPSVDLPVHAGVNGGRYYAGLVDAGQVWPLVSDADRIATDWWWILYPSHVPEQYPDFQNTEFITGGMGTGPDSVSPFFIIDDRWLVRKPPHIGTGEYSQIERRAYLPQWLQHEYFHHLFRTYPEFGLEDTPHEWFNRSNWPPDFVGRYEPDYFHEALYKRLLSATPPLNVSQRYATLGAPWDQLTIDDLYGTYHREPIQNAWHIGDIRLRLSDSRVEWRNTAGVRWFLSDDIPNGRLLTGPDCPYYSSYLGKRFNIVLERDALGDLTSQVRGFSFVGELYQRQ